MTILLWLTDVTQRGSSPRSSSRNENGHLARFYICMVVEGDKFHDVSREVGAQSAPPHPNCKHGEEKDKLTVKRTTLDAISFFTLLFPFLMTSLGSSNSRLCNHLI